MYPIKVLTKNGSDQTNSYGLQLLVKTSASVQLNFFQVAHSTGGWLPERRTFGTQVCGRMIPCNHM